MALPWESMSWSVSFLAVWAPSRLIRCWRILFHGRNSSSSGREHLQTQFLQCLACRIQWFWGGSHSINCSWSSKTPKICSGRKGSSKFPTSSWPISAISRKHSSIQFLNLRSITISALDCLFQGFFSSWKTMLSFFFELREKLTFIASRVSFLLVFWQKPGQKVEKIQQYLSAIM